jgi:diketogulonate reductase-like aldo/keto reductase
VALAEELMMEKTLSFGDRAAVPAIGQGTWFMGENRSRRAQEIAALRAGVEQGLTVIDTAEMYAHGGAEEVVGEAIRGLRDRVVLVSKVYPWHAGGQKLMDACEASLRRLGTDYLRYVPAALGWRVFFCRDRGGYGDAGGAGKNSPLGVSNLDTAAMQALWQVAGGDQCATNQVLYHLASRGIEHDLLKWCQQRALPVMAYSPLAQAGRLRDGLLNHRVVTHIAKERG